jgi:DNA-binding NarL/FixJ family response regulator
MAVSIMIFEDNDKLRESLCVLLNGLDEFTIVGEYSTCLEASISTKLYKPDVVLMDIDMPGDSGVHGVRLVKEANPNTAVIMYTVFEDDEKLFQCLCNGANGYLLKKTPPSRLIEAIHEVAEGGAPMSPSIARKVLDSFQKGKSENKYALSQREMQVLQLLINGHSTKIIADQLNISFHTARSHLKNIYIKLHVNCGKEAIAKALIEHILSY